MRNTFGHIFTLTSFGESHGPAIGGVVDGMPPQIDIDLDFVQYELNRRRPGQSTITTQRQEYDQVEFLSGIFEGKSTGCPIAFIVKNNDQHSDDYQELKDVFRPSHADYTYWMKYGIRDYRGGGRASARETIARVVAGALAKLALQKLNITVKAFTMQIGDVCIDEDYTKFNLETVDDNPVRCPDEEAAQKMKQQILQVRKDGDTIGGVVACVVKGCPPGLGEPVFSKLNAELAAAMMGINAARGFEMGAGFKAATMRGSLHNDPFVAPNGAITTSTNNSGGIQGGISNGNDIFFKVAFKPVPTLLKPQKTVDVNAVETEIRPKGRHDPCVVPRAVPIVEAMAAMTILDSCMLFFANQPFYN